MAWALRRVGRERLAGGRLVATLRARWHGLGMSGGWRLAVEGLGRIEHADAPIRPLTLLIGENNSGKSYFATLLWGLVAAGWDLDSPEGPELEECEAWAKTCLPQAGVAAAGA
jgi:hypothetical protein